MSSLNIKNIIRVNKDYPCPICGHYDWCGISEDETLAFCPRIYEGSLGVYGSWGYIHKIAKNKRGKIPYRKVKPTTKYKVNWKLLQGLYIQNYRNKYGGSGEDIFETGWDGKAYTYPLYNDERVMTGIQRIFPDRNKLMIKGSKDGIFWPKELEFDNYLLICEGLSDTKTASELGYEAVGRLSCTNGHKILLALLEKKKKCKPIIVADRDDVGIKGARKLAEALLNINPASILIPPCSDLRAWYNVGLTRNKLDLNIKTIERYWKLDG